MFNFLHAIKTIKKPLATSFQLRSVIKRLLMLFRETLNHADFRHTLRGTGLLTGMILLSTNQY